MESPRRAHYLNGGGSKSDGPRSAAPVEPATQTAAVWTGEYK
jgi:hypothetical protein